MTYQSLSRPRGGSCVGMRHKVITFLFRASASLSPYQTPCVVFAAGAHCVSNPPHRCVGSPHYVSVLDRDLIVTATSVKRPLLTRLLTELSARISIEMSSGSLVMSTLKGMIEIKNDLFDLSWPKCATEPASRALSISLCDTDRTDGPNVDT